MNKFHANQYTYNSQSLAERFWSKVCKYKEKDACWTWTAGVFKKDGYGQFWHNGTQVNAHRIAWELTYGPIPDGKWVLHHCDNPPCVRPDHLFLGAVKDNMRDMYLKNRHPHGTKVGTSKLSPEQVREIRTLYNPKIFSSRKLARMYGVQKTQILFIVKNKSWRWLS